ncbi:hypothetical protein ACSSVQ_001370 [Parvibaculum sp. MBR-TMA-1.3b-4.2]|jgi:hypothetical protein
MPDTSYVSARRSPFRCSSFCLGLFLLAIYFVGAEEGATSLIKGMYVHDGRHSLSFPCH